MRRFGISIIFCAILLFGCTEKQLERTDRIGGDINNVAAGGRAVLESPAGSAIPEPARSIVELVLGLASVGVITYQKWRSGIMKKTLTAVVKGIEGADQSKENPVNSIKASIQNKMIEARVFDQANKLVDKIKLNV